jgi:hypothetical protein
MSNDIYKRAVRQNIKEWLERPEIVVITGSRQVGKTFLVRKLLPDFTDREVIYYNFEDLELRSLFLSDPKEFLSQISDTKKIYIFDEFQKIPELPHYLKVKYDMEKQTFPKIILTGSSSQKIQEKVAQSLAGQAITFSLFSLSFCEKFNISEIDLFSKLCDEDSIHALKQETFLSQNELKRNLAQYLLEGGYPELGEIRGEQKWEKLKSIIQSILEKDLLSFVKEDYLFSAKKLLEIIAYRIGNRISFESLASALQLNIKTVRHLFSIFEGLYFLELIYPRAQFAREYKKAPKVYFHDSGIRNELIKLRRIPPDYEQTGALAENFVFNQLKRYIAYRDDFKLNYWQDYKQNEVDFILSKAKDIISIEVKYQNSRKTKLSKGIINFIHQYSPIMHINVTYNDFGYKKVHDCDVYFLPAYVFGMLI